MVRKRAKIKRVKIEFEGRSYKDYNKEEMLNCLNELDWDIFFTINDPNEAWDVLIKRLLDYLDRKCPMRIFKFKKEKSKWVTANLLMLMHDRDVALKRALETKRVEDMILAKVLKNRSNVRSKQAKRDYIKEQLKNNVQPENTANYINTFFANIGENLAKKIKPPENFVPPVIDAPDGIFSFRDIEVDELL